MANETVKVGTITLEVQYEILNHGTEENPMYDFTMAGPLGDTLQSDEWFPTIEEAESYIKMRLGVRR